PTGASGSFVYALRNVRDASAASCDAGLSGSQTFTILGSPVASITYGGSPLCANGAALVTHSGAMGGIYTASPSGLSIDAGTGAVNLTSSTAGSYTVTYTSVANGCTASVTAPVAIMYAPVVQPVSNLLVCAGTTIEAIVFNGANGYTWTNDNPSIGLDASGTGNIGPITAQNNGPGPNSAQVTVTPTSNSFAYVANTGNNEVAVIDRTTNSIVKTIPVGTAPTGVAVSPDGSKVYVTNSGSNSVSVIRTATNTVSSTVTVGSGPYGVAFQPGGSKAYVTNYLGGSVSVINAATDLVAGTFSVGSLPRGVTFSPDGTKAYVANYGGASVSVINAAGNTMLGFVGTAGGPTGVCVNPADSRYAHLKGKKLIVPLVNRAVPIIFDDYVDPEFGTGALKVTPAHDINDYNL
ncbi:MAG: hypothetical protein EOP50_16945, partial [Sphingobacteriales bacterium]